MLLGRIFSQVSSTEIAPRCTTQSTPCIAASTSAKFVRSAGASSSPGRAASIGAMSDRRTTGYRPRKPSRKVRPIFPAAPVIRMRFMGVPLLYGLQDVASRIQELARATALQAGDLGLNAIGG